jgi:hypothetical protein
MRSRRALRGLAPAVALAAAACASLPRAAPPGAAEAARAAGSYSAALGVRLDGPELRARTRALVAFRRPDALRVEVPGPAGPRAVVVARGGRLTAVFPAARAVHACRADADDLRRLLGVGLEPAEMMDVLVGVPVERLDGQRTSWGERLPRRVELTLPDGGRLRLEVEDAETGAALPEAAFDPPPHAGYRQVDVEEARRLWSR